MPLNLVYFKIKLNYWKTGDLALSYSANICVFPIISFTFSYIFCREGRVQSLILLANIHTTKETPPDCLCIRNCETPYAKCCS